MIVERARELTSKIDDYTLLKENKNQIKGLTTRNIELEKTLEELNAAAETARILVKEKIMPADQVPDKTALARSVMSLKTGFARDVKFIIEKGNWNPYITAYRQWLEAVTNSCQLSWVRYTDTFVPKRNEELLGILGRIPGLGSTVKKIDDIYANIHLMIETPPVSEEKFNGFKGQVAELKKLWESIGSDKIPEKVIKFLKASINEQGAELDLLDEEVLGWIRENTLNGIFRITIAD